MPAASGTRHLETPADRAEFKPWRLGLFLLLSCVVSIALAAFAQPPAKTSIRSTGPLPGINIP